MKKPFLSHLLRLPVLFVALAAALFWNTSLLFAEGEVAGSLDYGGAKRNFLVHVPPSLDPKSPAPLVVVLHASESNASEATTAFDMNGVSDEKKFIVVYPDGSGPAGSEYFDWNGGNCCGKSRELHADDSGFIRALIENLQKKYTIDPKRIYATGFSSGAIMTYRLGCELSGILAAIAPVSGALDDEECRPASPVSVIAFHGTADRFVLYNGGVSPDDPEKNNDRPVRSTIKFWAENNGCPPSPEKGQKANVTLEFYRNCKAGTEVALYTIEGGGHEWTGADPETRVRFKDLKDNSQEIFMADEIWDFFSKHPKT